MEPLSTYAMLGIMRQLQPFSSFFLDMFFPRMYTFSTEEIMFDKIVRDVTLAPFVSPVIEGKVRKKEGGKLAHFKPAYVKPKDIVLPEMLLQRRPGEPLGGNLSPEQRRLAVVAQLLDEQNKQIVHREEWMAAKILTTGKVVVEGDQYEKQEVDYGRHVKNTITVAGKAKWDALDKESRKPIDDLEDWSELCTGVCDTVIMGRKAWRAFVAFDSVQTLLDTRRGSLSNAETGPSQVRTAQFKGVVGSLKIYVYNGKYKDELRQDQDYMPAGGVLLGNSSYNGIRAYGAILDAEAAAQGVVEASRYPKNWFNRDPGVEYLMTQSAPLPIIPDPDAFVYSQVVDNA
ncbi:MAG: major capsid protein [Flavobacteriales bacterium]